MRLQALIDADNVAPRRLQPVLDVLSGLHSDEHGRGGVRVTASGSRAALAALRWPPGTRLLEHTGWQRADVALAEAYSLDEEPLLLASGDGDFGLLAARHPGDVLVVSGAPSGRLRDHAVLVDPAVDGTAPITAWLAARDPTDRCGS